MPPARRIACLLLVTIGTVTVAGMASAASSWGPVDSVHTAPWSVTGVKFATEPNGFGVAAWFERNATNVEQIWAAIYDPSSGWYPAQPVFVSPAGPGHLVFGDVVMDEGGRAALLYSTVEYDDTNLTDMSVFYVARFIGGPTWDPPVELDRASNLGQMALAPGDIDELYMVFERFEGNASEIRVLHYPPGGPWETSGKLGQNTTDRFEWLEGVAADESGMCAIAWTMFDLNATAREAWGAVLVPGNAWQAFRLDAAGEAAYAWDVDVAGDIAYFLYDDESGGKATLSLRTYYSSGLLGAADPLVGAPPNPAFAHISANARGVATAAWTDINGSVRNLWGARWWGAGWEAARELESSTASVPSEVSITTDEANGATVLWTRPLSGANTVFAARYASQAGWGAPQTLASGGGNSSRAQFAETPFGGVALWQTLSGVNRTLYYREFDRDTTPPDLSVDSLPFVVNNSSVRITGVAEVGSFVFVLGEPVALGPGGEFSYNITYGDGQQMIFVFAYDDEGNVADVQRTIFVDTVCFLEVTAPSDPFVTVASAVIVEGTMEDFGHVTVNGVEFRLDGILFSGLVPLLSGENVVVVEGRDLAGNRAQVLLHITYDDPIVPVAAALANATAALAQVQGDLDNTTASLDAVEATLAAAQAEIAAMRANGTGDPQRLAALEVQLNTTSASLAATRNDLQAAQARASASEAAASSAQTMAMLALLAALAGIALGAVGMMMAMRKGGHLPASGVELDAVAKEPSPPPK